MNLNESVAVNRVVKARLFDSSGTPLSLAHAFSAGDLKLIQPNNTIANATNLPTAVAGAAAGTFDIQIAQSELQQVGSLRAQLAAAGVTYFEWVELVVDPSVNNALIASAAAAATATDLASTFAALPSANASAVEAVLAPSFSAIPPAVATALASSFAGLPASTATAVAAALASAFAAIPAADAAAIVDALFAFVPDPDAPADCTTFQQQWNVLLSLEAGNAVGLDGTVGSTETLDGTTKHRTEYTVFAGTRTFTKRDGT